MPLADTASCATWRTILFITITVSSVTHGMAYHQDEGTDFDLNTWVKSSSHLGRPEWHMTRFILVSRQGAFSLVTLSEQKYCGAF